MTLRAEHADLLAASTRGTLVTLKRDGRPQLSNVLYHFDPATRLVRVSVTDDRAKTRNAARDPRVSLHVSSDDFWSYVVAEGLAALGAVVADPHDAAADSLVDLYRDIAGEHPDWEEFRAAQVAEGRLLLTVTVDRTYGLVRG